MKTHVDKLMTIWHSINIAIEAQHGLIAQVIKDVIFSSRPGQSTAAEVRDAVDSAMMIG